MDSPYVNRGLRAISCLVVRSKRRDPRVARCKSPTRTTGIIPIEHVRSNKLRILVYGLYVCRMVIKKLSISGRGYIVLSGHVRLIAYHPVGTRVLSSHGL